MLEIAEEKLENSERSLAQMERYLDLAAKSADVAKLEADAAKRSAGAAVNTAATQQARLNLEVERASAEVRPYVAYAGAEFDRVQVGKKIKAVILFNLSGQSKPRKVNVWSQFQFYEDSFNTPRAPACGKGNNWSFLGQFLPNGRVTSRRNKLPTAKEVGDYTTGRKSQMVYGAACYQGVSGRTHRTEFCAYKVSNNSTTWTACQGIADPT